MNGKYHTSTSGVKGVEPPIDPIYKLVGVQYRRNVARYFVKQVGYKRMQQYTERRMQETRYLVNHAAKMPQPAAQKGKHLYRMVNKKGHASNGTIYVRI